MTKHVEMIIDYITGGTDYQYNDNHGLLIRCRDCEHNWKSQMGYDTRFCEVTDMYVNDDHYCSFAKKRGQDD